MGCSVASFSCNLGWNEQVSQVTINLVRDPCPVPAGASGKVYWDSTLTKQTTMLADPGFITPNIGGPAYFRVGQFEYTGLVQSYVENDAINGRPTYTVQLVDPRQILDGTQLIIGDYAGPTFSVPNLINCYGYAESFGVSAPNTTINGGTFGSPANAFGGSLSNNNGMPWNIIVGSLCVLTSSLGIVGNPYNPYGRLLFRNGSASGYGFIPGDTVASGGISFYTLDLSEMPIVPNYWRLAGTSVSLLDSISQICQDACCDFYIELVPVVYSGSIMKVIKVRSVSRALQPTIGEISAFVSSAKNAIQYSRGAEMRNEVTSAMIVGGNQQTIYQALNTSPSGGFNDVICPYFGVDPITFNVVQPSTDSAGFWQFTANIAPLNAQLFFPLTSNSVVITEYELLSALGGFDTWYDDSRHSMTDIFAAITTSRQGIYSPGVWSAFLTAGVLGGNIPPIDGVNMNADAFLTMVEQDDHDIQAVYDYVHTYARDYYGKKFMVRLPYSAVIADAESLANGGIPQLEMTDLPSDGGWTEYTDVIGLPTFSSLTDFFTLPDNRLGCFVSTTIPSGSGSINAINLDPQDVEVYSGRLYVRAQTQPELVYQNASTFSSPRVVVSLAQAINYKIPLDYLAGARAAVAGQAAIQRRTGPVNILRGPNAGGTGDARLAAAQSQASGVGGQALWTPYTDRAKTIDAAAVPLRSTVQVYGPWYLTGAVGVTQMAQDEGLVPWEYGNISNMNAAGIARVLNDTASSMQIGELGTIEVPGYPTIPLGAELGAYDAGFYAGGTNLVEHRTMGTGTFSVNGLSYGITNIGPWLGVYGPNITSIAVEVGITQVTTSYTMRTFTPAYGRFSKLNSERLKRQGTNLFNAGKQFRMGALNIAQLATLNNSQSILTGNSVDKRAPEKGQANKAQTPHEVLVGQNFTWLDGTTRSVVATEQATEVGKEFKGNFAKKAFMSLEGLLRPVSLYGGGGLPTLAASTAHYFEPQYPIGALPILMNSGSLLHALSIDNAHLNPFATGSNAVSWGNTTSAVQYGSTSGHDITILGRGTTPPTGTSSLNAYVAGISGAPAYAGDVRYMALRGPIMLQSWGYDTLGKPIPNKADTEAMISGGFFTNQNLQDKFIDNWLRKPNTWPSAPVDLRFDRGRGVWTVPQKEILVGNALANILVSSAYGSTSTPGSYGNSVFSITEFVGGNGYPYYNSSGVLITNPSGIALDISGMGITSGNKALFWYDYIRGYNVCVPMPTMTVRAILQTTLNAGSSATAMVYTQDNGLAAGRIITVQDWLLPPATSLASGTKIIAFGENGSAGATYVLQEAACSS